MKQEEKRQLLLKNLCARLPYDFYIKEEYGDYVHITLYSANIEHLIDRVVDGLDKLVLRPMSSMTEEERLEIGKLLKKDKPYPYGEVKTCGVDNLLLAAVKGANILIDWLNTHHFDYHGLIEKGLALEALEGMYKI